MQRTRQEKTESRTGDDLVTISDVTLVAHSAKGGAMLCDHEDWSEEVWIPYSVIDKESDLDEKSDDGTVGDLIVKKWFAKKNNLNGD